MQFDQLKHTLQQDYSVIDLAWLEDLECQASGTLYRRWQPVLQSSYRPNQRFVLLNFRPVGNPVLAHVSWLIDYLDISPCFVLIVTNQKYTADWFQQQSNPVQVDMRSAVVPHFLPIRKISPVFNTDNRLCAHAWTGMHVWPNGEVGPCCEYTDSVPDHSIKTHTIAQVMHSDYMKNLRDQFRQGIMPAGCQTCAHIEKEGGTSKHQLTPYKLQNIYAGIDWESDQVLPSFVGGHLGNLCNLRCRICSPVFSSSIAAEELEEINSNIKSHPTYRLLSDNRWRGNSEKFWQQLREQAHTVCNFEFLGGEPLLLKENLEFMQWLIDHGHSQRAIFEFVTNGTQYPKIFDQADRFHRLTVTISIDNIQQRFEYERSGAKWSELCDNVAKFVACKQHTSMRLGVSITVNIQNVLYLPELVEWINQQGIDHYFFNILLGPEYLSIDQLTPQAKQLVLDRLTRCQLSNTDQDRLQFVIECVQNSITSDGQEFCQHMQAKDRLRNENFVLTHKEIALAMGYVLQSHDD